MDEVTPEKLATKYSQAFEELKGNSLAHAAEANVAWIHLDDGRTFKITIRVETAFETFKY